MNIVEIRVTLDHVEPTVTRTLQVPDAIRLDRLHMALQAAMGWDDMHLYAFTAGGVTWGAPDPDIGGDDRPADKITLAEAMADTGTHRFRYVYDFGDDWLHRLEIGPGTAPLPGTVYPRLTEVAGRCPPEDVGGVPGYEMFLAVMADPAHPEHDDLRDWHGGDFDPDMPDADALRSAVLRLARRWAPRPDRR